MNLCKSRRKEDFSTGVSQGFAGGFPSKACWQYMHHLLHTTQLRNGFFPSQRPFPPSYNVSLGVIPSAVSGAQCLAHPLTAAPCLGNRGESKQGIYFVGFAIK